MVECKYCGREFESKRGLNIHIGYKHPEKTRVKCDYCGKEIHKPPSKIERNKHNFCSQKCFNKWKSENWNGRNHPNYKSRITETCKQCGRKFKTPPYRDFEFCSQKCYRKFQQGKNSPHWKPRITKVCKQCGEKFQVHPYRKDSAKFCSMECLHKWHSENIRGENHHNWKGGKITKTCKQCGREFKAPHHKKEQKFCSRKCYNKYKRNHPEYRKRIRKKNIESLIEKPTKPEQRIIKICKEYNLSFEYTGDGKKFIGDLNPDFLGNNGNSDKIIEVFGDFWHSGDRIHKWTDTEFGRKAYFSQFGYNTLILWTSEMKKMSDKEIVNKIKGKW